MRLMVRAAFVMFLLVAKCRAQSEGVIPKADAGHASQVGCVILQHMGRGDRTKSNLYSLGIRGKQFRYVEGILPEGFPSHDTMTNHDVRNLQARGAQVIVLDSSYTSDDLKEARANCRGETDKTPDQAELKRPPAPATGAIANTPARTPETPAPMTEDSASSAGGMDAALLDVSSSPTEADVYVDERFSGRTPSTIILKPGNYKIAIKKIGFVVWQKKFKLAGGRILVDADLVPKTK